MIAPTELSLTHGQVAWALARGEPPAALLIDQLRYLRQLGVPFCSAAWHHARWLGFWSTIMAVTPWMNVTSDLQIVSSGLNKAISSTTGQLTGIDTVVVAGARLGVRF